MSGANIGARTEDPAFFALDHGPRRFIDRRCEQCAEVALAVMLQQEARHRLDLARILDGGAVGIATSTRAEDGVLGLATITC